MDKLKETTRFGTTEKIGTFLLIIALTVGLVSYLFLNTPMFNRKTREGFANTKKENFTPAKGSGRPDCSRMLSGSAEILDTLVRGRCLADNTPKYMELTLILSKLGCLKQDIMNPSRIVEATRYQPYDTAHDIELVSEIAATCMNKTIPKRDLDIAFEKWRDRGSLLIRELSVSANLTETESSDLDKKFMNLWTDVYDVARDQCLLPLNLVLLGSDVSPREPESVMNLSVYDGYALGGF